MPLDIHNVVINCDDPHRLSAFWAPALAMDVLEDHGSFVLLGRPGTPVTLGLQRVPEPRVGRNRALIDLRGEPRDTAARRLVGLGATIKGEERPPGLDLLWTVMTDRTATSSASPTDVAVGYWPICTRIRGLTGQ